jgi:prophage antirepressor-like protein
MSENIIKTFINQKFGTIRTVSIGDEPYFVAKDIAIALGYAKPENAVSNHVDTEDKTTTLIQGAGSNYKSKAVIINESGLYSLIFGSKLKDAKQFKHWVTSEVLPTIRKTGGYVGNDDLFINTYLPFADEPTKMLFRTTLTTINQLNAKIEKDRPLVEFAECVGVSEDCISMGEIAKIATKNGIKIGRTRLFELLRNKKILQRDNIPYQRYIEQQPWFKIRETVATIHGRPQIKFVTEVTPKGQKGILRMLKDMN